MDRKGLIFLAVSVLIFVISVARVFNAFTDDISSISANGSFDVVQGRRHNKILNVRNNTVLRIKVSSHVKKGNMTFTVLSPDNKVVYRMEGQSFYDIEALPVTQGKWEFIMETDYAEKGCYYLRAEVRNNN